jgi:2-polyprenyl-3-methyl-5-hydroxy-6-metoxy-1,4-benzoquinol methylase
LVLCPGVGFNQQRLEAERQTISILRRRAIEDVETSEMTKQNSYADLLNAPPASRKKVAEDLYNQRYEIRPGKVDRLPAKRRLKRIAIYKSIIGHGHQSILELGCGPGDLTYALVDHAEKIVGTDISANAVELASLRKKLGSLRGDQIKKIEFKQMSAVQLDFPDAMFDWAVSTSMIEHLHPMTSISICARSIECSNPAAII